MSIGDVVPRSDAGTEAQSRWKYHVPTANGRLRSSCSKYGRLVYSRPDPRDYCHGLRFPGVGAQNSVAIITAAGVSFVDLSTLPISPGISHPFIATRTRLLRAKVRFSLAAPASTPNHVENVPADCRLLV